MPFVEMDFIQFHRIAYAHSMTQAEYQFSLSSYGFGSYGSGTPHGGVLEIGFVEKNPLVFELVEQNETVTIDEGSLYIIPPNHHVNVTAQDAGEHKHCSVEFLIDCTTSYLSQETLSPADFQRVGDQTVILPYVLPAAKDNDELFTLIRRLARDHMLMRRRSYFDECLAFMQLISGISALVRRSAAPDSAPPSHKRYCQKAKEYISQHIDRRISLEEIAAYVGINKNYLTNVFASSEHVPISEYINRIKLNHILELIMKYNYSIKQAGETVGLYDVNYISRLFKKYHGITISEYRYMHSK